MPHTITRQHRTFHKGTWRPTSCATTITNPVGQQPTPTHRRCSTRGSKRERNLHAEGRSSPSKPSAGGRPSGRRSRRVRNRRTVRQPGNFRPSPGTLHPTPPPKGSTSYNSPPPPQPRANTTPPLLSPPPTPQIPPPAAAVTNADETMQNLLRALITLGQAMPQNPPPQTLAPTPSTQTRTRAPDAFDGSNPEDLRAFLLQCQITFNDHPQNFTSESAKVCFAISYLKKIDSSSIKQGT